MQPESQIRTAYPVSGGLSFERQRVLRNTYLLLAATMVPTVMGAVLGMNTAGMVTQHPIVSTLVMLGVAVYYLVTI